MAEVLLPVSRPAASSERLLEDHVVIVTGGTRGIGRAIVEELCVQGARVCFTYQQQRDLAEALVEELAGRGCSALSLQADVTDFPRAQDVVATVLERFGRLDGLVNNAGVTQDKALMLMDPEDWHTVIETNLTGVFHYCRAAIVTLMKQRSGRIVNLTSVSGLVGMARQVNYAASKAGIIGLTKALAKEVAAYGILVNAVAPGFVDTDMTRQLDEKRRAVARAQIPLGRFGTSEEVASVVAALLSRYGSYITGQVLTIDGGLTL